MPRLTPVSWVLVGIGVVLLVIGIVYLTVTAPDLPSFFPGHVNHAYKAEHYNKRAALAIVLAAIAFVGAFFTARRS